MEMEMTASIPKMTAAVTGLASDGHWQYCTKSVDNVDRDAMEVHGNLSKLQTQRCGHLLIEPITLGSEHAINWGFSNVAVVPAVLLGQILLAMQKVSIEVAGIKVNGSAVEAIICEKCHQAQVQPLDLNVVFDIGTLSRQELFSTRELLLDALFSLLPAEIARKSRHMVAAAYVQRMVVTGPQKTIEDETWAKYSLPGVSGFPNLHIMFQMVAPKEVPAVSLSLPIMMVQGWCDRVTGTDSTKDGDLTSHGDSVITMEKPLVAEFVCMIGAQRTGDGRAPSGATSYAMKIGEMASATATAVLDFLSCKCVRGPAK